MTFKDGPIPYHVFQVREKDGKDFVWKERSTRELFSDKKVVLFGVPGAFTPTCSSSHLPDYERDYDLIRAEGVDEVYCISMNDSFVMNAWFKQLGIEKVKPLPDGNSQSMMSSLTGKLWVSTNLGFAGMGRRSIRYSAVLVDGKVDAMFQEEEPSQFDDPFVVSDSTTMLEYLRHGTKPSGAKEEYYYSDTLDDGT